MLHITSLLIALAGPAPEGDAKTAQDAAEPADAPFWTRERVTGDWFGLRSRLEDHGLSVGGAYTAEFSSVLAGGVSTRGSFRNLLTLDAELDLETAFGVDGASVFVQYLSVNPESGGSADAGDIQGYSNIENAFHLDTIYELWYQQELLGGRVRFKLGKFDANSEFNAIDAAGQFANSSAGFSPTIAGFPSYPASSAGVAVFVEPVERVTLSYGFFDGASGPDGVNTGASGPATFFSDDRSGDYFHVWEAAYRWDRLGALAEGEFTFGATLHTGAFERFDNPVNTKQSASVYCMLEQRLIARDTGDDAGLHGFLQLGLADEDVSEFGAHLAGGLVARGMIPGRPDDSAGLYATYVDLSDNPGAGFDDDEFTLDAYYRLAVTPAVFVQPELQYIVNPSGAPSIDNALVAGIRVGVAF